MAKTLRSTRGIMKDITMFIERSVEAVADEGLREMIPLTPKKTGRARDGWVRAKRFKLRGNRTPIIENKVPYIGILDGVVEARGGRRRGPIIKPALEEAVYMTRRSNR